MSTFEISEERTSPFAERVDWSAPLPLGYRAAVARALELRNLGEFMSYRTIALVMRQYHGFSRCDRWWRRELIAAGAELRPHGNPFPRTAA